MSAFWIYQAVIKSLSPIVKFVLNVSSMKTGFLNFRFSQVGGYSAVSRPKGSLLWFHAASLGEGSAALPIIHRILELSPSAHILLTTRSLATLLLWENIVPPRVLCQLAPFDSPKIVDVFLHHWKPEAGIFMESEFWPNLLCSSLLHNTPLALLNGRISDNSFARWNSEPFRPLITKMLQRFTLVMPMNNAEGIKLQVLGVNPMAVRFGGDLKYATSLAPSSDKLPGDMEDLSQRIRARQVAWIAGSTHSGEERVVCRIHRELKRKFPDLLTVISPRNPDRRQEITNIAVSHGLTVSVRSKGDKISPNTGIYLADTLGELSSLYRIVPIAFVGGSLFPELKGHNFAEPAVASCAVVTGPYVGHFSGMAQDFQRENSLSVKQVSSEGELLAFLDSLMSDRAALEERQLAAVEASRSLSRGIVENVWSVLRDVVLKETSFH